MCPSLARSSDPSMQSEPYEQPIDSRVRLFVVELKSKERPRSSRRMAAAFVAVAAMALVGLLASRLTTRLASNAATGQAQSTHAIGNRVVARPATGLEIHARHTFESVFAQITWYPHSDVCIIQTMYRPGR
jgi:hypothetical protein